MKEKNVKDLIIMKLQMFFCQMTEISNSDDLNESAHICNCKKMTNHPT